MGLRIQYVQERAVPKPEEVADFPWGWGEVRKRFAEVEESAPAEKERAFLARKQGQERQEL